MALPNYFGAGVAARYDEDLADRPVEPMVAFLAELAGDGAAIEFAIGTGRVALPLARRGVRVSGIDLSPDMVAVLRAKPGAEEIDVAIGDMTTIQVDGSFRLAYIVANSFINVTTQEGQLATFANVAAHLEPRGCFAMELGLFGRAPLEVFDLTDRHVGVDEFDISTQRLVSHHFNLVEGQWERISVPFRSVSTGELDLMARLAGMQLRERWGGWGREPFTAESTKHVSVWEKA